MEQRAEVSIGHVVGVGGVGRGSLGAVEVSERWMEVSGWHVMMEEGWGWRGSFPAGGMAVGAVDGSKDWECRGTGRVDGPSLVGWASAALVAGIVNAGVEMSHFRWVGIEPPVWSLLVSKV